MLKSNMEVKHAPTHMQTPWTLARNDDQYIIAEHPQDENTYRFIALCDSKYDTGREPDAYDKAMDKANAAFIVRAVNEREEMLSALRLAQATIHATWKSLRLAKDSEVAKAWQVVTKAIAKAEGKE
jgi:hypothetical protein